jgi:hypothetical protein
MIKGKNSQPRGRSFKVQIFVPDTNVNKIKFIYRKTRRKLNQSKEQHQKHFDLNHYQVLLM